MAIKPMKHIKKRFQFEIHLTDEAIQNMENVFEFFPVSSMATKRPQKGQECILLTEKNLGIKAFHINLNGVNHFVPEPDPILVYFHNAYTNFINIKEAKQKVLGALNQSNLDEDISIVLYSYFGYTNGYVIFLFTAIEAFINRFIPGDYKYNSVKNNRTEVYNRDQIQRYLSFDDKLNKVVPDISKKDFAKSYPLKYQLITNLKEFRNIIVHTKADPNGTTPFDYIYKKALNFKYEDTLLAVRDLLNYYQANCVEDCPCGEDW